jgi:Raf kinase inhibitor-like YbhB/YbcL family protein
MIAALGALTALALMSPAFGNGATIPVKYTCDGAGFSPPLRWTAPPRGTRSFTLTVIDPDAPDGRFVHWTASAIPASSRGLATGAHAPREGRNSAGETGWTPPCPPAGPVHRYVFTLTAVGAGGRALARARLVGRYARVP